MKTNTHKMYGYSKEIIMCKPLSKISLIGFLVFSFNNMFPKTESASLKQGSGVIVQMKNGITHKEVIAKKGNKETLLKTANSAFTSAFQYVRHVRVF